MLGGGYRALDLTDLKGSYCGKMLAEIGVDVIKVEPPTGSAERERGPFYHDEPHPERSLTWFAYNANKRGITLNPESFEGRDLLRRLVLGADFLIESFSPGYMDGLGLGYEALRQHNPRLIYTAITPFGQHGPYARYAADDLTLLALGGMLFINGDPDRAPLQFTAPQSFPQAGAQAAAATMIAHQHRAVTGEGQLVDLSMHEAITQTIWLAQHYWTITRTNLRRVGGNVIRGPLIARLVFPCRDGFVAWRVFGSILGAKTQALVRWMEEEGEAGVLADLDFEAIDLDQHVSQDELDGWEAICARFFLRYTKAELHREAARRGMMLFPLCDTADLLRDPHLAAREFWTRIEHPSLGACLRYPGLPYRSTVSGAPAQRPAPLLGQHNATIYGGELGYSQAELAALARRGVI